MRPIVGLLAIWFYFGAFSPLFAQSLVSRLPADGIWAAYDAVFEGIPAEGTATKNESEVIVRAVGTQKEADRVLRWLEIEIKLKDGKSEVLKFLIAEADVGLLAAPLDHIVKHWCARPEFATPRNMSVNTRSTPLEPYLSPAIDRNARQILKANVFETRLGKLECHGVVGKSQRNVERGPPHMEIETTYTEYDHEQSPFGSVYFCSEQRPAVDGKPLGTRRISLTLRETGTSAASTLPEAH